MNVRLSYSTSMKSVYYHAIPLYQNKVQIKQITIKKK